MSASLFRLLHLADSTLPIGGFTHSAGLETYVQQGLVKDFACAEIFVTQMLSRNIQYTDGALASLAYDAAMQDDIKELIRLNEECTALKLPREMREASAKMGSRLMKIFESSDKQDLLQSFKSALINQPVNYCVLFAVCAVSFGIAKKDMLAGFFYNTAAGFITNCVKLIPLGQQQGQQLLHKIQPLLQELAENCLQPDRELLGICCPGFDISQMQHEFLYSRLYIS